MANARGHGSRATRLGVAAVLVLGSLSGTASAATISGLVTDADSGQPLPYASISLSGRMATNDSLLERGASGDPSGNYRIDDVPVGHYEIRVAYVAYTAAIDSVVVEAETSLRLDFRLSPSPIATETIVVEGSRIGREKHVQPAIVDLSAEQLARVPAIGEPDPIRSLQLLPGVQSASDVSSGLYIRGGGPDQTLILLDGVTVYNPTHALGVFSTFNTDAIDNVTLYKGAYPAEHGGRLGAVVDIGTRTPNAKEFRGKASISTISARLTMDGPVGSNHWLLSGRRTYLEPILSALRKSTPEIPYYSFYDVNAKFVTDRNGGWSEIIAYRGRDDLRIEPDPDVRFEIDWGNTVVAATFNRSIFGDALAKLAASYSEYESLSNADAFNTPFSITNRLRDLSARAQVDWQNRDHASSAGLVASVLDFRFEQSFNRDEPVGFNSEPVELALYFDDQWMVREGTALRTGLRSSYISEGDRVFFEPRISASQELPNKMRLKLAGGVYNQYLQLIATEGFSAADLYVPVDETAAPGRSIQGVVGMEWNPSPTYQLSLEGYYTDLRDLVAFDNNAPVDQESFSADDLFHTGGSGYATGLEVFAQRRTGRFTGWLGYTLAWSRRTFEELNAGEAFAPKFDRRHDFKAVLNYRSGRWSYSSSFILASGQAFTPASARYRVQDPALGRLTDEALVLPAKRNSARLLPYHRFDFSLTRTFTAFGQPAEWYLQFFNLYSRRNEWFVQFDRDQPDAEVVKMLPIVPSLGVSFSF